MNVKRQTKILLAVFLTKPLPPTFRALDETQYWTLSSLTGLIKAFRNPIQFEQAVLQKSLFWLETTLAMPSLSIHIQKVKCQQTRKPLKFRKKIQLSGRR